MSEAEPLKHAPAVGSVLAGKYEVERVIGAGAMGVVVAARHRLLRQTVALKLIASSRETHATAVARFTREAQAIAGLASDHIVRILDFGLLDEGTPFMVMQYLPGHDLASEVRARGGRLPQTEAVDYAIHACAGLAVAHAAGVVHRDIKPGNLLLTRRPGGEPLVVIVDFGISKMLKPGDELSLTVSQTTLGSPLYMSPEQIRDSKSVDCRTDIWSLGMVLRFLLAGRPAFTAHDASGVLAAVIADEPAPIRAEVPDLSPGLEAILERCFQKKPAFRYASAADLARALSPYASESGAALAETIAGATATAPAAPGAPAAAPHDPGTFASTTRGPRTSIPALAPRNRVALGFAGALACALGASLFLHRSPRLPEAVTSAPAAPVSARAALASPPKVAPIEEPSRASATDGGASSDADAHPVAHLEPEPPRSRPAPAAAPRARPSRVAPPSAADAGSPKPPTDPLDTAE